MVRNGKNGDLHLKQIAYYKRTGEYHPTTLSSERSGIRRAAKKFVFKEKKLFYVGKDRKQNRLVVVSEEEKKKVLRECHENGTGVHHGISRTLTLVESSYYWTSVTNDVKQWVYACQHCQVAKNTLLGAPQQHLLTVGSPWSVVTADLMGPFHTSDRSHVYAIIVTDLFTKWVMILPLCDVSASEISKAIINIFFLYGPPQKIVMDQRDEFIEQMENNNLEEPNKTKTVKKKPKQLNPFHLKVGHEVLRQRKNWWKDGRFQSEWVGPCVIDYITESGCAVLRDHTGARLKRPIKMSHLRPYVRESTEQDSLYLLQGSVVADHDYIGFPEIPVGAYQANILVEDATIGVADDELLATGKDHELLEYRNSKISVLVEDQSSLEKQTFSLLDSSNQVLEYLS
ncbi:gypsy retrotransposon integrase-like protein 1 [Cricetulus griseus]|nr:gypsy retrotransposon integrase-like protein 1 [Cricetulus griseus]